MSPEFSEQTLATIKLAETVEKLVSEIRKNDHSFDQEKAINLATGMIQKLVDSFTPAA